MDRRSFFHSFAKNSAAIAATAALTVPVKAGPPPDKFERDGWRYIWSGWRQSVSFVEEIGFWYAKRLVPLEQETRWPVMRTNLAHSTAGGVVGFHRTWDQLNSGTYHEVIGLEFKGITPESTEAERSIHRNMALARLIKFLDEAKAVDLKTHTSKPETFEFGFTGFEEIAKPRTSFKITGL